MAQQYTKLVLRKLFWGGLRHLLSDQQYAKMRYWLEFDRVPDLQNPQRFTEKIQYLKLNHRIPLRQKMANRSEVRPYVERKIGDEHLIPLIGEYEALTPQLWESLPNQFVLKANHGCGMLALILDKTQHNFEDIRKKTEQWQQFDYAEYGREWAYKDIPRTIIAEELLLDANNSIPKDYKFFCFHGEAKIIQIDFDRFGNQRRNLYDRDFNKLDTQVLYPPYEEKVERPKNLEKAIKIAEKLSEDINFVRVDLYLLDEGVYFGELTNYPGNGFIPFEPEEWEYKVGSYLNLKSLQA